MLIDKHAAHERMIYEKLKDQRGEADRQLLLQPIPVTLEKNEYAAVLEGRALWEQAGFEIEDFGPRHRVGAHCSAHSSEQMTLPEP